MSLKSFKILTPLLFILIAVVFSSKSLAEVCTGGTDYKCGSGGCPSDKVCVCRMSCGCVTDTRCGSTCVTYGNKCDSSFLHCCSKLYCTSGSDRKCTCGSEGDSCDSSTPCCNLLYCVEGTCQNSASCKPKGATCSSSDCCDGGAACCGGVCCGADETCNQPPLLPPNCIPAVSCSGEGVMCDMPSAPPCCSR